MSISERRTKIVCTVGPAVSNREMLLKLAQEGMNVARLNFSHGDHADFARTIEDLRSIEEELGRPIGIMADVQGPKLSRKARGQSGGVERARRVWITTEAVVGGIRGARS